MDIVVHRVLCGLNNCLQRERSAETKFIYYAPLVGKGAVSVAFVRPSVNPSRTQRIIREPKGLVCPNLEGGFPTLDATSIPDSRSKRQRSGSPGPLMMTYIVRHIFKMLRPTNFQLGVLMEDDDPHQLHAP